MYVLEKDFQKDIKNWLEKHECVVYKTPAGLMTAGKFKYSVSSGFPDLIVFNGGHTILIELKTDKKTSKLRKTQVSRFKKLNEVDCDVYVVRPSDFPLLKKRMEEYHNALWTFCEEIFRTWEEDVELYGQEK